MADDYPNGVAGMPQEETGERSIQSEMVPGAGPVRHTTEAPSREIETETRRNFQHLSLNVKPTTFRPNEPIPAHTSTVEDAQSLAPQTQTLPPQRSHSSSSTESDEQLKAELQSAGSDSEKVTAIYKRYAKEQRRKSQKSETEIQHLKLTVQNLTEQLESTQGERSKLLELLVDAQKETTANESSLKAQIEILENKILVLQEALTSARSGEDIPNSIHLQLVAYELSEGPTCPFSALNNHAFFHLLVTNMIQTRGTHCLGCFQKVGRIDSHPYSKCILTAAAAHVLDMQKEDVEHMRLFWREDLSISKCADDPKFYKHATVAKACTYPVKREAFCGRCDNSTSDWEREFSEQFGRSNIELGQDDITEAILLIQMFRGSILSIDIRHYMECQPCSMYLQEVGETMRELMMLHLAVCEKNKTLKFADVAHQCKQLKPIIFHNTAIKHRILFPMVVNIESYGIILYAQIPPYFWAVPSPRCAGRLTEIDLSLIVSRIAELCSQQEEDFFHNPDNIDAKKWKETVQQPLLVFPLFNSKCCIKVTIPLE